MSCLSGLSCLIWVVFFSFLRTSNTDCTLLIWLVCYAHVFQLVISCLQFVERMPWDWDQWLEETGEWLEKSVLFDPMMMVWATLICGVLTAVRSVLNSLVFIVSSAKGGGEGGRERGGR